MNSRTFIASVAAILATSVPFLSVADSVPAPLLGACSPTDLVAKAEPLSPAAKAIIETWAKVETLEREISVFHYVFTDNLEAGVPRENHVSSQINAFWNLDQKEVRDDARGYYAAADPFATIKFGNVMFLTKLAKKHRTLDLNHQKPLTTEILSLLDKEGCHTNDFKDPTGPMESGVVLRRVFTEATHRGCRQVALQVLKKLNVDSIAYNYGFSVLPEECDQSREYAFVLLKAEAVTQIEIYGKEIPNPDPYAHNRMGLTSVANRQVPMGNKVGYVLWNKQQVPATFDSVAWARDNLFACQQPK